MCPAATADAVHQVLLLCSQNSCATLQRCLAVSFNLSGIRTVITSPSQEAIRGSVWNARNNLAQMRNLPDFLHFSVRSSVGSMKEKMQ